MISFGCIETSTVDYVIFETASTLKDAIVREWNMLQEEDIMSLRQYLLQYIIGKPTLPVFVRERILQVNIKVSCFIIKVGSCFIVSMMMCMRS